MRTLAIGQPHEQCSTEGELEVHVGQLSYFSRLADASTFTELADVEMQRRQVREAEQVCAVTDGADWCQAFTQRHRPDALRILDFPHAAEHVSKLLEALVEAGLHFPDKMLARCLHVLKHRGPRRLLHMADRLGSALTQRKGVQEQLDAPPQARSLDAVSRLSGPGLADWLWYGWGVGRVPTKTSSRRASKERECIGNAATSIPCSPYARRCATIGGGRCGEGHSRPIESCKRSTGLRGQRLEHRHSLLVVRLPLKHPLLPLLRYLSRYLLLHLPNW